MSLEIIIQKRDNYCCSNGKPDYTVKVAGLFCVEHSCMVVWKKSSIITSMVSI